MAQTLLLTEDFNDCELPAGWSVDLSGNPDAVWRIGLPDNENSDGSTIDGSCMLIIDDDETGENTPSWTLELHSPVFDGTAFTTVGLDMDVHFRNYDGVDALEVLLFNGVDYHPVKTYQGGEGQTGEQFSEFETLLTDLSFFASDQMQLVIRYNDNGTWGWWAGVDNITIWGEGEGQNVLLETFNDCVLPDGWINEITTGVDPWQFGLLENDNATANSMNGSCFLYFDDDGIGQEAAPSTVLLISPEIDGTLGSQMTLSYDLIIRTWEENESLIVGVYDVDADDLRVVQAFQQDVGGPQMNEFETQSLDLSAYRAKRMRLVFLYDDGDTWGWWIGMDNIKLSASGELNELCTKAEPIDIATDTCLSATTELALFDGPQPLCSSNNKGSLWYTFTAPESGWLRIQNEADFNDVITLFTGDCADPTSFSCENRDEHGFTGEEHYVEVTAGQDYFLRISGQDGTFGLERGRFCLDLDYVSEPPTPPVHDLCAAALPMTVEGDCVDGNNFWASWPDPLPSRAILSRAGVWYQFTATDASPLDIRVNADFADALTLYSGDCDNLTEVAANEYGQLLQFPEPEAGQAYYLQVTGAFATVEGNLCASVQPTQSTTPENDDCGQAMNISLDGECVLVSNQGASFDGPTISCDAFLDASIWFSFTAPASGTVQVLADADFPQAISVYAGDCGEFEEIYCATNPLACDGYLTIGSLAAGQSYFIRISSLGNSAGISETGDVCLFLRDGAGMPSGEPLSLEVDYECFSNGTAALSVQASGGDGNYFYSGTDVQQVLGAGEFFLITVTDGRGCEQTVSGTTNCAEASCSLATSVSVSNDTSCFNTADGAAAVSVEGGSGEYNYAWPGGQTTASVNNLLPGDYVVTITDGEGCDAAALVQVSAPPPIFVDILDVQHANGGPTGYITYEVSGGTGALSVSWLVNGVLNPELDPNALSLGDYQIQVVDESGCIVLSEVITINDPTDVNNPFSMAFWVSASPNPTTGPVRLDWQLPQTGRLVVFDALGKVVKERGTLPAKMTNYTLDLRMLPGGVYLLRWESNGQNWVERVVVQ